MIEQLSIQNFQAHTKARISFDPNITCIIGPSDAGKSAIIRALRWICTNQPGGNSFIQHGTKGCTVKLKIDGHNITRKRSLNDAINEYILDDEVFKSFGRGIPEPISKVINMNSVSWQGQHDPSYWFNLSAGEVSRQLNSIIDLSIIDNTLSAITKTVNKASTRLEIANDNVSKAEKQFSDLEWVTEFCNDVYNLTVYETISCSKREASNKIYYLFSEIEKIHNEHASASLLFASGDMAIKSGATTLKLQKKRAALNDIITIIKRSEKASKVKIPDISVMESAIKRYRIASDKSIILKKIFSDAKRCRKIMKLEIPQTSIMQSAITKYKDTSRKRTLLYNLMNDIQMKEKELCKLKTILKEIKDQMPEECPTCKQPLPK